MCRNRLAIFLVFLALTGVGSGRVSVAADIMDRVGAGVTYQPYQQLSALSMRFFLLPPLALSFQAGVDTDSGIKSAALGAKLHRVLFQESHMSFFSGAALWILSGRDATGANQAGGQVDALIGAEFFLPGLPNLGFMWEAGVALKVFSTLSLRTFGGLFTTGSVHYYF